MGGISKGVGVVNELLGAPIASAATLNLNLATGNLIHVTGNVGIGAITLFPGAERTLIFDGTPLVTPSASLLVPGNVPYQCAAGDRAIVRGDASGVVEFILLAPTSGSAVVGGGVTRSSRVANTIIGVGDNNSLIIVTANTFTQTWGSFATLGTTWSMNYWNQGTGNITHTFFGGTETCDGLTTFIQYPGEERRFSSNGTNGVSEVIQGATKVITVTENIIVPPGYRDALADLVGGAGGAGSGRRGAAGSIRCGGSAGGGGARLTRLIPLPAAGTTIAATIGAGGTGGAAQVADNTDGNNGVSGGNTSFGTLAIAYGGFLGGKGTASSSIGGGGGSTGAKGTAGNGGMSDTGSFGTQTAGKQYAIGGAGGGAPASAIAGAAEWGGGGGGSADQSGSGSGSPGGTSLFGGAGGGAGGGATAANQFQDGLDGGNTGVYDINGGGGGAHGAAGAAGTAGATGTNGNCGTGGGGGGSNGAGALSAGGAGGFPGGGGGGAGNATNGTTGGAGGAGGNGQITLKFLV